MRSLPVLIALLGVATAATAGTDSYDIYMLACDHSTDCLRVADVEIQRDGPSSEYAGSGFTMRIDTLATNAEAATVRLSVSLQPKGLAFASLAAHQETGNARISFQLEPCIVKRNQYGFLGTVSGGNKVYQVWGRLMTKRMEREVVAAR